MADSEPDARPESQQLQQQSSAADKTPNALRRCFICLTDQEPSDPPSSWVDPCPCTLEAHQDCMLSWVTDCERSNKPLQCPVCKSAIQLEGPWDPVVAFSEVMQRRFTKASPFMLFTGVTLGVQFSSQMYGALAMWMFSGHDALMQYLLRPDLGGYGRNPSQVKFARLGRAAILMNIAPALLLGKLLPNLSNRIFVSTGTMYGFYHFVHDEKFFSWPPSPQAAIAVFPYIRSTYYNLWRDYVSPYESNLNRQILGLPPVDPGQNNAARENRRNAERNGEGGLLGILQNILDVLDPDDDEQGGIDIQGEVRIVQEEVQEAAEGEQDNQDAELVFEVVIGDGEIEDDANDFDQFPQENEQPQHDGQQANIGQQENQQHEAPQAPPVQRAGIGSILSNISNSIVSALILPAISAWAGEALYLMLPKSWTSASAGPRFRFLSQSPGLLRNQWGRSLIGGCMYVVLRDILRLYAKSRKVAAMSERRVKNVDRRRGGR